MDVNSVSASDSRTIPGDGRGTRGVPSVPPPLFPVTEELFRREKLRRRYGRLSLETYIRRFSGGTWELGRDVPTRRLLTRRLEKIIDVSRDARGLVTTSRERMPLRGSIWNEL